jgi:hypothetical protein
MLMAFYFKIYFLVFQVVRDSYCVVKPLIPLSVSFIIITPFLRAQNVSPGALQAHPGGNSGSVEHHQSSQHQGTSDGHVHHPGFIHDQIRKSEERAHEIYHDLRSRFFHEKEQQRLDHREEERIHENRREELERLVNHREITTGHARVEEVDSRLQSEQRQTINGDLNRNQESNLERLERSIHEQEVHDLQKNNGHITVAEQQQLNHEENHLSHEIQKDEREDRLARLSREIDSTEHHGEVAHNQAGTEIHDLGRGRVAEVNAREANEQQNIGTGIADGKLNSQQAAQLEKREQHIQQQEARDLEKNDGHITPTEQNRL